MFGTTYKPVCGSDGNTYSNIAMLNAFSCLTGTKISKSHDGPCGMIKILSINVYKDLK